jgi:hypothetical protein
MAVLNRKRSGIPPGAVYVGRPSKLGNPFVIGRDGTRGEVVAKYRVHFNEMYARGEITLEEIAALDGVDLVCWCAPLPCHADVIAEYAARAAARLRSRFP